MNDEQLLQALRHQQPEVFRDLVDNYQRRVINICYRFVLNRTDAEDLAQEVFVEVYQSAGSFRGQSSLSTWIFRIAVSKSLDFLRRQGRAKRGGRLRALFGLDNVNADIPAPASTAPDGIMEQEERRRQLQRALNILPTKQRTAFVLSQYDGVSYKEIAEILKCSVSAVESLVHRARKSLQRELADFYGRMR